MRQLRKPVFTKKAFKALVEEAARVLSWDLKNPTWWEIAGDYFLDKNHSYAAAYFKNIGAKLKNGQCLFLYELRSDGKFRAIYKGFDYCRLDSQKKYKWGEGYKYQGIPVSPNTCSTNPDDCPDIDVLQPGLRLAYYHKLGTL